MVSDALVTDLYELTMADAYLRAGQNAPATFALFVRRLPPVRGYLIAAGIEAALDYLERLRFTDADLAFLRETGRFSADVLTFLAGLRFSGAVRAVAEGTPVFAEEPILEVTAPLIEAQIVETYLINVVHLHTLLASKAARCVDAADGRPVIDFGLRRAHGVDAGMAAARAAYLAGCTATSNVAAGRAFAIPLAGTMAHSFVLSFASELEAFRAYARAFPDSSTLLIDTFDTEQGARTASVVAAELAATGHRLRAVRIDSGNLDQLSRRVRAILDGAGLSDVQIVGSGGLDEYAIEDLVRAGAPIDSFGVGTRMDASEDAPTLDMAYKLVEYAGRPVFKLSTGKESLLGRKQVWRYRDSGGYTGDVIARADESIAEGAPLLALVMRDGRRLRAPESLAEARARCLTQRALLPATVRRMRDFATYPVALSRGLAAAQTEAVARRTPVR